MMLNRKRLKVAMICADVTIDDLSKRLGLSRIPISRRINGRTKWRASEVDSLEKLFGVSPGFFQGGDPEDLLFDR